MNDKTKDKIADKKTDESLILTQLAIDKAADSIFWMGEDAKVVYANESGCRSLGYTYEEILKLGVPDFDPLYSIEKYKSLWEEMKSKKYKIFESIHKTKDGRCFPVEIALNFVNYGDKEINFAFVKDITARKNADELLKESEEKYRFLVDRMEEMAVIVDKTGKILFANKYILTALGYNENEVVGEPIASFLMQDSLKKVGDALMQEFLGKPQGAMELELKTKKGEIRTILLSEASNPINQGNKIISLLVNGIDITDRKKSLKLLKEIEDNYHALLEFSTDQIFMLDKDFRYLSVSNSLAGPLGKKPEEIVGKSIADIYGQTAQTAQFMDNITNVISSKKNKIIEEQYIISDNMANEKTTYISTQLNPISDESGAVIAVLGILRDITDRKMADEALQSKVKEMEKFNKLAVDRELKMVELKREIKELKDTLSKSP